MQCICIIMHKLYISGAYMMHLYRLRMAPLNCCWWHSP